MHPVHHAAQNPDKPAVMMATSGESLTYGELNARSNQVAHLLRDHGLKPGDAIAVLLDNCPDYFEIAWGAQRAGLYFTCVSTKLQADEIAYILKDSASRILFVGANLLPLAQDALNQLDHAIPTLVVGGAPDMASDYRKVRSQQPETAIADESAGADMLYSSGTTGRPKGIKIPLTGAPIDSPNALQMMAQAIYGITADSRYLSPAPLYHAAPLRWCMSVHKIGGTVVVMEKFEPEAYLAAVQHHRITDSQLVPTMFVRMLKLDEAVRTSYDLSSLKMAVHAAAPCPVAIKEQMMAWWGPIIFEYYAGTEGNGFCTIAPHDWLRKKGSVGKALLGELRIVGEDGQLLPAGEAGTVYFANGPQFEYHNSPEKTAESRHAEGWSTLGDVGYVDDEGFLFLTDRKAFMIISGGVNIYPQESENVLVTHPKVADVAVFGVPNDEFGEEVKAVVQPMDMADTGPDLEAELLAFCRNQISHIKAPRSIDFMAELPRYPTGKLYKRLLRDRYWADRENKLV
ncbi:long-chain-fatty-acid-CoA ligase FadD13 [Candidatus Phycosocius bacilliformis]|uniref:Long-chain-fatty-acid-CoA ligase FadD13 n=1 Tax=Candidatus Phycosocius bacilliformis TaxID=1445552 RepID=A0A2P2E7K4_9PROT|nr:acyl-CoA synthetase [Candidatus Phycosocius bacilliformis]GBF57043.1 long-chain-fatty-acid-CoA ligase FadD13 [Candidatus Phycosocius bacilliformis]